MNKRKICIVTGTRAEFGLMQILMRELQKDPEVELLIIATGMHLSPEFNLTYRAIEEAGFTISKKIEVLLSSDSTIGISKSMGLAMISFSEAYNEMNPDLIVVLGDRFEIFGAVSAAMICRIPIGHIHGGEATEGLIDEPIRHSITKMSHLHFTATEEYRQRVIQLGEQPDRVFFTGTPGIDNVYQLALLNRSDFERSIDFKLGETNNILVTFHPVTLEQDSAESQFEELLLALGELKDVRVIFTMPNADTGGRIIMQQINNFVANSEGKAKAFSSLGQLRYLSALKNMDLVLGNSSSGLIEAPSFKIPTVNIGDRQKGRIKAASVIDCDPDERDILKAINRALSPEFKASIKDLENPYGIGGASKKIKEIVKSFPLSGILKKKFYDL
jgi:GDP/UDP-N,N'-diacetylbacillosamine 2-epimerase (hydrolysing)